MYYPFSWFKSLFKVGIYFAFIALLGAIFDNVTLALIIGIAGLLGRLYWQLYRLNQWLWHSKKITPPQTTGVWEYIYEGIYYLQRRNRRKQKSLSKMVKRFREGAEALPDAVVVVDANNAIIWCNRLARIQLGLRWPQDSDRRIDNLIRHPLFIEYLHSEDYQQPIEVPSPLNQHKILEYRIMPYGDKHLLLISRDVTHLKQMEQMRKDFVANVSHELRTPLTVLSGYLEMLPDNPDIPETLLTKAYSDMSIQACRMQNLIEQLLVLSRIEASAEKVFEHVVDVPQMLAIIKGEAQALNQDLNHQIEFDVDPNLSVLGIDTELRSAFSNLIFNAVHYTKAPGKIKVSWRVTPQGTARFSVKDNGEGIANVHINRLTERFYRVDKARSRSTGGSGLGLSIVKHVLTHHNSQLVIKSEMGEGSEFSFSLSEDICVVKKQLKQEDSVE